MKIQRLSIIILFSIALFSCSKNEDESEPENANENQSTAINDNVTKADLIGTWTIFERQGSDGVFYGLNQWIPEYYTDENNCLVKDVELSIDFHYLIFTINDSLQTHYKQMERERDVNSYDSLNCNHTYLSWTTISDSVLLNEPFQLINSRTLVLTKTEIIGGNPVSYSDSLKYVLRGDILELDNGKSRFKKQ